MESPKEQLCPWCQTLITWDPEIGPEEECPHCYNKLEGYRTINVKLQGHGVHDGHSRAHEADEDDYNEDEREFADADDEDYADVESTYDSYDENIRAQLELQEEAPECPVCREQMLLAGTQTVAAEGFAPASQALLGKPFLQAPFTLQLYVCPYCFRADTLLADHDRLRMIAAFRDKE